MTIETFIKAFEQKKGRGLFALFIKSPEERNYLLARLCREVRLNDSAIRLRRIDSTCAEDALDALHSLNFAKEIEILVFEEAHLCSRHFYQKLDHLLSQSSGGTNYFDQKGGLILSCSEKGRQLESHALLNNCVQLNLLAEKVWEMRLRWQQELRVTAKGCGIELSKGAAALIVDRSGDSRFFAQSGLETLCLFAGFKGSIDEKEAQKIISSRQDDSIWPLVRALEQKNNAGVWTALKKLLLRNNEMGVIALVRVHFQGLLSILESQIAPSVGPKEPWQRRREQQKYQTAIALGEKYLLETLRSLHFVDEALRLGEIRSESILQSWFLRWVDRDE